MRREVELLPDRVMVFLIWDRFTLQAVPREHILQLDFAESPVTAGSQPVPTRQFTNRAFDGVALVHS